MKKADRDSLAKDGVAFINSGVAVTAASKSCAEFVGFIVTAEAVITAIVGNAVTGSISAITLPVGFAMPIVFTSITVGTGSVALFKGPPTA